MLDLAWLCGLAIRCVYSLVLLACDFLGYSPLWAQRALKQRQHQVEDRKVPNHLAVLYTEKKVNKKHLLALFDLCISSGVRRLSIYDPWNDSISMANSLRILSASKGVHVIDKAENTISPSGARLTVYLLPADSGRGALVETCRQLSNSKTTVTIPMISEHLSNSFMLTEPDFLLQVGQTPCLAGYPPWSIRVTEILPLPSLPCSRSAFDYCLDSYSNRDIRLGK